MYAKVYILSLVIGPQLNSEEYGEALALAQTYNLDCDRVYQRRWQKAPATVASIHDYLVCITRIIKVCICDMLLYFHVDV